MSEEKGFDCVAMKNEIQSKLLAEWAGKSDQEIKDCVRRNMAESDSPIAELWRGIAGVSRKTASSQRTHA